jgi:hypothetical protein
VVIGDAAVQIRVVGPKRDRFVFRDLAASPPLSPLDLERVRQTLRLALRAVAHGPPSGPTVLTRADARATLGLVDKPRPPAATTIAPPVPPAPPPRPALPPPPPPKPAVSRELPPEDEIGWALGASFEVTHVGSDSMPKGPGLFTSLALNTVPGRPAWWASLFYGLPQDFEFMGPLFASQTASRIGFRSGAAIEPVRRLQLGFGIGWDRVDVLVSSEADQMLFVGSARKTLWMRMARLSARLGPFSVAGVGVGVSAFVDVTDQEPRLVALAFTNTTAVVRFSESWVRPGAALEVWFR